MNRVGHTLRYKTSTDQAGLEVDVWERGEDAGKNLVPDPIKQYLTGQLVFVGTPSR